MHAWWSRLLLNINNVSSICLTSWMADVRIMHEKWPNLSLHEQSDTHKEVTRVVGP